MFFQICKQARVGTFGRTFISALIVFGFFFQIWHLYDSDQRLRWELSSNTSSLSTAISTTESSVESETLRPLELPLEYGTVSSQNPKCFASNYLDEFRRHAVAYGDTNDRSNITCFHSRQSNDGKVDSLCFVRGANFDVVKGKFMVECSIRKLGPEEKSAGLIPFKSIRSYWYETGPPVIFRKAVEIHDRVSTRAIKPSVAAREELQGRTLQRVGSEDSEDQSRKDETHRKTRAATGPPHNFLLLKREGEANLWHCIMEIFSAWMTIDILRISRDPSMNDEPFFRVPEDVSDTQIVITDEREDGPYFDLWTLFAKRKPVRLRELVKDQTAGNAQVIEDANLIVPLAGSSNPLWDADWFGQQCKSSDITSILVDRVLKFFEIEEQPLRTTDDPIVVTFIQRVEGRRLRNETAMFEELQRRFLRISVALVDFAAIPFAEQLRVVRGTDVLVGVHGAGLTHAMFMREREGAVVEIQPQELTHNGFHDIALIRGLEYFRAHAASVRGLKGDDWHRKDIEIDAERFQDLMGIAIKSMYSRGAWNLDVN